MGENLEVFDHVTIGVSDLRASTRFYDAALEPLGLERREGGGFVEWGDVSIAIGRSVSVNVQIALAAPTPEAAEAFGAGHSIRDPDGTILTAVWRDGRGASSIAEVALTVADVDAARSFYEPVLRALGANEARGEVAGERLFARDGVLRLVHAREPTRALHIAFAAAFDGDVDAFWRAGLEAGFESNGAPGERPQYHRGYYGAFLLDPAGNNVEAVCHNR